MDDVVCKHGWSRRFCEPCSSAHIISQLKGPRHMGMLAIKPDQIPDAVADSMREFFHTRGDAQRAIAAALNAWPGMKLENLCGWVMDGPDLPYVEEAASIILPLPQENSDD